MAEISRFLFLRHLRSEPTSHVLVWRDGERRRAGPGLAFWFLPLRTSISELPLDDRELPFLFRGRSADFQEVVVNGSVTWRVLEPERLAARIDFSIDSGTGAWRAAPLDKLAAAVTGLAQQLATTFLGAAALRQLLAQGVEAIRLAIHDGLVGSPTIAGLGLEVVGVTIASVAPTAEMESALQTPARERIQQGADQATFERRALAVEKERAIQENELANQIELARREETLIAHRGQNERRRATEAAESGRIAAEAAAASARLASAAQADGVRLMEEARVVGDRERMAIYRDLPTSTLLGLAAHELAGKLQSIDHLTLSPDILGGLLQRVLDAGARKLEG